MRKTKKIAVTILTMLFMFTVTACDETKEQTGNTTKNTTGNSETTTVTESTTTNNNETADNTTAAEESSSIEETTTMQEETTIDKSKIFEQAYTIDLISEDCKYVLTNENCIDALMSSFHNREYHTGDVIDCQAEIKKVGGDISECGNAFSMFCVLFAGYKDFPVSFDVVDIKFSDEQQTPIVTEVDNHIIKNVSEVPFKTEVEITPEKLLVRYILLE